MKELTQVRLELLAIHLRDMSQKTVRTPSGAGLNQTVIKPHLVVTLTSIIGDDQKNTIDSETDV